MTRPASFPVTGPPTGPVSVSATEDGRIAATLHGAPWLMPVLLTSEQAEQLAWDLRRAVFDHAPELVRVLGYDNGGGMTVLDVDRIAVYGSAGYALTYGLACPHEGCGHIAWDGYDTGIDVVDEHERWSTFFYEHEEAPGGDVRERVTGSYSDTGYESLGYRCGGCFKPVTLPEGVEDGGI